MTSSPATPQIQIWHIDQFVFYVRNPRKNDAAVDRMCASLREFGFKIPVLARKTTSAGYWLALVTSMAKRKPVSGGCCLPGYWLALVTSMAKRRLRQISITLFF